MHDRGSQAMGAMHAPNHRYRSGPSDVIQQLVHVDLVSLATRNDIKRSDLPAFLAKWFR